MEIGSTKSNMNNEPEILYVNYALGNTINNTIYINKILKEDQELHDLVLNHEKKHASGQKNIDWDEPFNSRLFFFILRHPSTWIHFLPVWISGRKIIYSKTMAYLWFGVALWFTLLYFTIKWN